jgi:SNF2 family DNA or RNA helicase
VTPQEWVPKPYHDRALPLLLDTQRCALWMPPGFGKTSLVYAALDILKLAGSKFFPALIIAPKQVCDLTWPAEQKKWRQFQDLKVVNIRGSSKQRLAALHTKADIYLINFENIEWIVEVCSGSESWPFGIVVVDEATKLKGYRTKQGGKRAGALAKIARDTGRFLELTGTPAPNGLKDLWGQIYFLDFGSRLASSYNQYMQRWFIQEAYTRKIIPRAGAAEEIHSLLSDCAFAFRTEDWFDIQKPVMHRREVRLQDEAAALYRKMERDFFIRLEEVAGEDRDAEVTARIALTLSSKLIQMAAGGVLDDTKTAQVIHEEKLDAVESLINELGGENLIVVYQFVHEAKMLQQRFPHARIFKGKAEEEAWNAGNVPLMLLQPQRGGHGVNLQHGGRNMAFFSPFWDLELRLQVVDRIGPVRQANSGYNRAVNVYDVVALDTLDNEVLDRTDTKASVMDALMAARAQRG